MESIIINLFLFVVKATILYVIIWDAVKNGIISAQKYMKETGQDNMTSSEVFRKWKSGKKGNDKLEDR
ncbi:MAG: hypothetical protein K2K70_07210 [Lachnospiraceae bacterium]|nr:hypothetical protein [Lachnospiraceae bacterium]